ncbi:5'-3' exonuclease [Mycoplasma ovis str. Michigan]|uniref:5'-3' exonuclease n=1 Tax=Mycoplasma ovis str. Michigan TaxID=1415773 RepID=A0ABM5P0G6_9MOLU|nr:5'-3' exonuclease H3TH domain-containing protein [Mycoplasma ovis]AHC39882.1 5'-3' exonuclease [Mycoplasma ovis str. Michigan]
MIKRALIIDGSSMIHRCFHSVNTKENNLSSEKLRENFFSLFSYQLRKLINLNKYIFGLLAFDIDRKSFRTEILPSYKDQRPPMPQELLDWFPEILEKSKAIGINYAFAPKGFEADDLIGTVSKQLAKADYRVDIVSTDKDLLQLVDYLISMFRVKSSFQLEVNNHMNFAELNEGLLPLQIPLFKALSGDSSDNYSGIPGIGEKNANKLVKEYQTKERLVSSLSKLPEGKIKRSLQENLETLDKCLKLSTIQTEIKFKYSLSDFTLSVENNSRIRKSN